MKGTVISRTLKDGTKRYDAVWRAGGKQRWKTFERRKDADRFLTDSVKKTHDGTWQPVKPTLMNDLFDRWRTHSLDVRVNLGEIKPSTAKSYRSMVDTHFEPVFGEYRSDQLSPATIGEWRTSMSERVAVGTVARKTFNNLLNLLHAILAWARHPAQSYLGHDPLVGQKRLKPERIERDFLEREEIAALLNAATTSTETAILMVAIYTGLRRGELFALRWDDLDSGQGNGPGRLRIQRSVYQGAVTVPKTEHSIRVVDLPRRVLEALDRHKADVPPTDGDYVFRTAEGTPIDPDNWYRREFSAIRKRANLRGIGLHALRHTYASLLIKQGESIKYVSKQLGHGSIQITADLYVHLFKETSTMAMRRLDKVIPAQASASKVAGTQRKLRVVKGAA